MTRQFAKTRSTIKQVASLIGVAGLVLTISAPVANAQTPAKELFGHTPLPSVNPAEVHGFYSKGCISGAVAMPTDGPTWQAMRLERNRRWGHPDLIALVQKLSRDAVADGWPGLLVGDISQPRGGPMLTGHASHQVGLDADIWLTKMPNRKLTRQERRDTSAISVLKKGTLHVDPNIWTPEHGKLIARAARFNDVERLFVHPGIKKAMCDAYGGSAQNASWLGKVRPYYGHHYHFHIRMKCPQGSTNCRKQNAVPAGSGCDASLDWWFTKEPWTPKPPKKGAKPVKKRVVTLSDLPNSCSAVLREPEPASEQLVTLDANYDPTAALASARASSAPIAGNARRNAVEWPIPGSRPY
ncbi:penicillin-insensitive murein endopeptidase [Ahrensia marina]|uniref:Peptidase n=1 Tax=Ahrensia marina TaxID=1514904 RepID=A0A0N0VM65_9HYPH|nr:penicillin-insensitive murein endopeptidase [Ahrensia marina]KPB02081.1 peptidase [Ahrensia marina]